MADISQVRDFLRKLPHAEETMQWGANLVYWVGDKAIGGKMFTLINLDEDRNPDKPTPVIMFYAGPERYAELLETEGVVPAPYMARIYWIALTRWDVFRRPALEALLRDAHAGVHGRLPKRVRASLDLPAAEQEKLVAARRKILEERASAKKKPGKAKLIKTAATEKPLKTTTATKKSTKRVALKRRPRRT